MSPIRAADPFRSAELRLLVLELGVVEGLVAGRTLLAVQVRREVFGDEAVEEHAEHVALEVPAVDAAAEVVGYPPDGLVEFGSLRLTGCGGHVVKRIDQQGQSRARQIESASFH